MADFSEKAKQLLADQLNDWALPAKNYSELKNVQLREFQFNHSTIKVQFNPARIVSSAAKVDQKSIQQRKCFLCAENRPAEQQQIDFGNFHILVNPFPIFPEHFTIPLNAHVPQRIAGHFDDMLGLAEILPGFTIFYNGPRCGASAPDHFHFQAGKKGFMPIEKEVEQLKAEKISEGHVDCWPIKDGLRNFFLIESSNRSQLNDYFSKMYALLEEWSDAEEEPMLNILAGYESGKWQIFIFPRAEHRPWQYFEEGEKNILLSPASVDMGGVLITPLEKDFSKLTATDVTDIFQQVLWSEEKFDRFVNALTKK